jgi:hypothetical protein
MKLYQNLNVTGSLILTGSAAFTGSLTLTGSLNTVGTITATTLVVQTITSSISAITGSTQFGSLSSNTHQFTGSVLITGSVGIGTSAPIYNDIVMPYAKTATSTAASFFIRSNEAAASNPFGLRFQIFGSSSLSGRYAVLQTTDYNSADGGSIVLQPGGGNIGIGLTNPSYKLHVSGAFSSNPGLYLYGTTYAMIGVDRGSSASSAGTSYYTTGSQRWFTGIYENTNNFGFYNAGNANFSLILDYTTGSATFSNNVQVGSSTPNITLSLSGDNSGGNSYLNFLADSNATKAQIQGTKYSSNGGILYLKTLQSGTLTTAIAIDQSGQVGIGTTSPEGPLHLRVVNGGGYGGMAIINYSNTINTSAGIDFGTDGSTAYNGNGNGQIKVTNTDGTTMKSEMNLNIWNGSSLVTGIKISDAGRVSFPTTTAQNYAVSNATATTISSGGTATVASCTLTTTGKPVLINVTGDINPIGGGSYAYIFIYRDGSQVGKKVIAESSQNSMNIPFALCHIDIPSAGSHTYTAVANVGGANSIQFGETGDNQAPTILAIELL